ncbi:unnamed protein product [Penicillium glandicola]
MAEQADNEPTMPPQTPKKPVLAQTPPASTKGRSRTRGRAPRSTTIDTDAATDTGDEPVPTIEYDSGTLADDVADDNDLGPLAAALTPPQGGWSAANPKPKLPAAPKTNITRFAAHTEQTFALALGLFYDESTLYALRWHKANMAHPIDGQRNGKRPGPSSGGKIDMETVSTWMVFHFSIHNYWDNVKQEARLALSYVRLTDEGIFYCLCTMTPYQRSSRFQADFDQHGDIRTTRIPLDPPMIIWANGLPWFPVYKAFYVLCGSWNPASYLVGRKYRSSISEFYVGVALAPPEAVRSSQEDSLTQLTLRAFDSANYPHPELDLIHVATISRGQNKVACRFIMKTNPAAYVLVYQTKEKEDLAFTRLQDLRGFHERICSATYDFPAESHHAAEHYDEALQTIPQSAFDDIFTYGRPFPVQHALPQDASNLHLVPWDDVYTILDSFGNPFARQRRRARREKERRDNLTSNTHIPSWGRVAIAKPLSGPLQNTDLRFKISQINGAPDVIGPVVSLLLAVEALFQHATNPAQQRIASLDLAGLVDFRARFVEGDPRVVRAMRDGLGAVSLRAIRDAAAFAEGLLLVDRCIETMEDNDLRHQVEAIAAAMRPPPQTPLAPQDNEPIMPDF